MHQKIAITPDLLEQLAAAEHASWSRWMEYLLSKCAQNPDGSLSIPRELVDHWRRQIETPYAKLSEKEKEADRDEVRRILPLIDDAISGVRSGDR
jgi:hypothetical protein